MAIDQEILEVSNMFRLLMKKASQDWNRGACKMNLSFPQFQILYGLNTRGPLKVSELADALNMTSAAITGLADKLCSYSYVERERATDDRRVVYIKITDAWRSCY
ncbi:MarR family transcriptional regulator [Paenibacillus sp. D2_2]|uniref:MarR family winged helix-turn-helix transcriptional regulator n=1 Tax=Paenibacillus sp. D2_2 TaxID=3073092 RepID=UPI002816993D|nr:MarR family transcriptional regulator [Paenibacillus sp. D2_2]WMT38818.1 MarR family transcriptional regulator [Paenibacillus sp. D2_2]